VAIGYCSTGNAKLVVCDSQKTVDREGEEESISSGHTQLHFLIMISY